MNIIESIKHPRCMKPFLQDKAPNISTWNSWLVEKRLEFGLPVNSKYSDLVLKCTGRPLESFKADGIGYLRTLILAGRRSGKSRMLAIAGAWLGSMSGLWEKLAIGEQGLVVIICPTKRQGQIIFQYMRSIFSSSPLLEDEVLKERAESFVLRNGITIEIMVGDYRAVRGFSVLAALVDEICFFQTEESCRVKSDGELIAALTPSLATTGGRLVGCSTKYSRTGWAYKTWKKHWGNPTSNVLVWDAASQVMNSTLSQEIIDAAMENDPQSARSEFMNEWRDDISIFIPESVVENVIIKNRLALMCRTGIEYSFFCDVSGGRAEDSVLAIAHFDTKNKKSILDQLYIYKAPNSPAAAIEDMCKQIKFYNGTRVVSDAYAGNFVSDEFQNHGIQCEKSPLSKSKLYLELLGHICSNNVELLDLEILKSQLCGLERRTRSGGADSIDHAPGRKDDAANAAAGVLVCMNVLKLKRAGVFL